MTALLDRWTILVDETILDDTFEDSDDEYNETTRVRIRNMAYNFDSQHFRSSDNRDIPPKEMVSNLRRSTRNQSKQYTPEKEETAARTTRGRVEKQAQPLPPRRTSTTLYSRERQPRRHHLESDWRNNRGSRSRSPEHHREAKATWSGPKYWTYQVIMCLPNTRLHSSAGVRNFV